MMQPSARAWRQWVAAATAGRRKTRELLYPVAHLPLKIHLGHRPPRTWMLFTKEVIAAPWLRSGDVPDDAAFLTRPGFPTEATRDLLAALAARWNRPLRFVGDLRPLDLSIYFAWRRGYPGTRGARDLPVRYCGIDDTWLDLCARSFKRGYRLESVLLPMGRFERTHLAVVETLLPELERLVGPRSLDLLRSGWTLHQEGASNPKLYRQGFTAALRRHLLAAGERRGTS